MRTAAALLCVGLAAVACTPPADAPRDEPGDPPAGAYTLFSPDLDGARPTRTQVYDDRVLTTYDLDGVAHFTLVQRPTPDGDLCRSMADERMAGDTCRVVDGVMITRMEDRSGVAVVRGGTLLFAQSLVTEGDEGLLDRATTSLQQASVTTLDGLGEAEAAEATPEPEGIDETPPVRPVDFRVTRARDTVKHLAGTIGPREATSPAYDRAARWLGRALARAGYDVARQPVDVPSGVSWGVPVDAGRSVNVIATPPGFVPDEPHVVVGAHLDTVPQAPGAEDNASGIGVIVAAAEALAERETRLPVVFVAFGAEEPRGATDADHHYGSREYVARLPREQRAALRAMVSLDRVGVGSVVPIGSAEEDGRDPMSDQLARAAQRAGVPVVRGYNRSSDHWQFVQAGLPGARLGSTSYAAYHSAQDVPAVVDDAQLRRVGRLLLAWLAP